jgi:hypothetical protein
MEKILYEEFKQPAGESVLVQHENRGMSTAGGGVRDQVDGGRRDERCDRHGLRVRSSARSRR